MGALAPPVPERPSTTGERARALPFPLLDELRAVAALTVLAGHIYLLGFRIPADRPLSFAGRFLIAEAFGVPLFFLLSGFLLYGQFARAAHRGTTVPRARFWRNRARRILPAYWTAYLVLAIYPGLQQFDAKIVPFNLALLHAWIPGYGTSGIGPAWSLCAEVAFYAMLPFIAALTARLVARRQRTPRRTLRFQLATAATLWTGSLLFDVLLMAAPGPVEK